MSELKFTGFNTKLCGNAKNLRHSMTVEERHLWYDFLRNYPVRFRRQRPISGFIADFYCEEANLVIELDGSQHYTEEGKAYDAERTAILEGLGLKVLRFSNSDIDRNFRSVCEYIDLQVNLSNKIQAGKQENTTNEI